MLINQKLYRSNALVIDDLSCCFCGLTHFLTQFWRHEWRWCLFKQLLVTTLNGTIALTQMTNFSVLISSDLDFDVTWVFDVFLHVQTIVSEGCTGFLLRTMPCWFYFFVFPNDAHTTTTTTSSCLHDNGVTDFIGDFDGFSKARQ